jgi:hypothetical protein
MKILVSLLCLMLLTVVAQCMTLEQRKEKLVGEINQIKSEIQRIDAHREKLLIAGQNKTGAIFAIDEIINSGEYTTIGGQDENN